MFKKREPEPERPRLLGEDFDIFPDLGDRPANTAEAEAVEEEPEEEDVPVEPTPFQKKVAAISEENWKKYQVIAGVVLGLLAGICLSFLSRLPAFGNMGLIVAAVVALIVPNMLEKQAARKIPRLRVALIIALAVCLGFYMLYGMVLNPGFFEAAPTPAA